MEKKPLYYDGSGQGLWFVPEQKTQKPFVTKDDQRKNISGNPYVIDWNLVKKVIK